MAFSGRGYSYLEILKDYVTTLKASLTSMQKIVLIVHGGNRELSVLERLDINLTQLYTVDTVKAAQYPLRLSYRYSLRKLLENSRFFQSPPCLQETMPISYFTRC